MVVLSGDNPRTVGAIAQQIGLDNNAAVDARDLGNDQQAILDCITRSSVLGRVTPAQKRLVVGALQEQGNVVAMTGDGVNDSLALKSADVGIAMGDAAPATKAVAQFVLLDNAFASLPVILAEGRRVIANVERVAQLFLAKNAMSFVAIVVGALAAGQFPVLPRQMTLLSTLTIGIPAFVVALAPNTTRFTQGFLRRIVSKSVPVGATIGLCVVGADHFSRDRSGTAATLTALTCFFMLLAHVARPLTTPKKALIISLAALSAVCMTVPHIRLFFGFDASARIVVVALLSAIPALLVIASSFRATQ